MIDVVVITMNRNTVLQKVATIPAYAAKHDSDRKLLADKNSTEPIAAIRGGPHVPVPFVDKDGGRLDAHALAHLRTLAIVALEKC